MRSVDKIAASLREKGLKLTPQRRLIIEILSGDRTHPTVDEVYRQVVTTMPEVSRTTVYNTIREMASLGEIVEVQDLSDGGIRYDTCAESHHHFFCLACRSLIDVDVDLPRPEEYSGGLEGYQVMKQQLTLYGICPSCRDEGIPLPGRRGTKRAVKKKQ
jgi:Fe2+ or Zn2+ uptake regulation protein